MINSTDGQGNGPAMSPGHVQAFGLQNKLDAIQTNCETHKKRNDFRESCACLSLERISNPEKLFGRI